jgi:hypothetical protein
MNIVMITEVQNGYNYFLGRDQTNIYFAVYDKTGSIQDINCKYDVHGYIPKDGEFVRLNRFFRRLFLGPFSRYEGKINKYWANRCKKINNV